MSEYKFKIMQEATIPQDARERAPRRSNFDAVLQAVNKLKSGEALDMQGDYTNGQLWTLIKQAKNSKSNITVDYKQLDGGDYDIKTTTDKQGKKHTETIKDTRKFKAYIRRV